MSEVEHVTKEYLPLAQACSSIFFVLDDLYLLHHFYQFSLRFFLDIFDFVLLHNPSLKDVADPQRRLAILIRDLFLHVFKRTSRALLHSDHLTLAVLLAQVKLRGSESDFDEAEFNFLLEGGEGVVVDASPVASSILDASQTARLQAFGRLSCFKDVCKHLEEHERDWTEFLASNQPETVVPEIWKDLSREPLLSLSLTPRRCFHIDPARFQSSRHGSPTCSRHQVPPIRQAPPGSERVRHRCIRARPLA